jgi:quercetin 2,3-dioxygenase
MTNSFVLRADQRGYNKILSTGATAAYVGGRPDAFITRFSSFNFADYQDGRPGFGRIRVFGDEAFYHPGCSYNMHPHHNFIICAFVLEGKLTHINTLGGLDELAPGDFYAFSAGSGGLHEELNRYAEPMRAIYLWLLPDRLVVAAILRARPFRCRCRAEPDHRPDRRPGRRHPDRAGRQGIAAAQRYSRHLPLSAALT